MKQLAKRLLLGTQTIPQWVAVSLRPPQRQVSLWLHGTSVSGAPLDITQNATVAALRPLTIAMCLQNSVSADQLARTSPALIVCERGTDRRVLGRIDLKYCRSLAVSQHRIDLFEAIRSHNYCLPWLRLQLHYLNEWRMQRIRREQAYNFSMPPRDLHSLFVFYMCPRPVVLVTVMHDDMGNVFPMDLIGATDSPYFLMALRQTSPAVQLIHRSRHMVLGDVPANYRDTAYDLGRHHKSTSIDLSSLPFETTASQAWSLPVAKASIGIKEVELETTESVGSHELFITRVVNEEHWHDGPQLFHVPGLYQSYLARHQRALTPA